MPQLAYPRQLQLESGCPDATHFLRANIVGLIAQVSAWRESGCLIRVRGHQFFVRENGRADQSPLLLIHGFPTSSWDWQAIWPELERDHRLICFDMLGFGFSDKPARHRYSIFEQADIAQDLLAHLGVIREN